MQIAVEDEPASRVDPDRLVDTAVRRRKQRRSTLLSGGAVVVVAVAAILVASPALDGDRPARPPVGASPTAQEVPSNSEKYFRERSREWTAHLRERLPELLRDATKIHIGEWTSRDLVDGAIVGSDIELTVDGKRHEIGVWVAAPWAAGVKPGGICWEIENGGQLKDCGHRRLPDGSELAVITTTSTSVFVDHKRQDGTMVSVHADTTVMPQKAMIDIAIDPKLGA